MSTEIPPFEKVVHYEDNHAILYQVNPVSGVHTYVEQHHVMALPDVYPLLTKWATEHRRLDLLGALKGAVYYFDGLSGAHRPSQRMARIAADLGRMRAKLHFTNGDPDLINSHEAVRLFVLLDIAKREASELSRKLEEDSIPHGGT